jgi:hypothetical protein
VKLEAETALPGFIPNLSRSDIKLGGAADLDTEAQ